MSLDFTVITIVTVSTVISQWDPIPATRAWDPVVVVVDHSQLSVQRGWVVEDGAGPVLRAMGSATLQLQYRFYVRVSPIVSGKDLK